MGPLARLSTLAAPFFWRRCATPAIIDEERGPTDTEKLRELLFSRRVRLPKAVDQLRT
jgi:hypothetical protein